MAELPLNHQARIKAIAEQFIHFIDYWAYEMMVTTQSIALHKMLIKWKAKLHSDVTLMDLLVQFHKMEWEEQCEIFPIMDGGHSANTSDTMCRLCRFNIERPDLVPKFPNAMAPITGWTPGKQARTFHSDDPARWNLLPAPCYA